VLRKHVLPRKKRRGVFRSGVEVSGAIFPLERGRVMDIPNPRGRSQRERDEHALLVVGISTGSKTGSV